MMQILTTDRAAGLRLSLADLDLPARTGREDFVRRALGTPVDPVVHEFLARHATGIDVSDEFVRVVTHFATPEGHTPAGFRRELGLQHGTVVVDLQRDIGCGEDGRDRPTKVLYSADSANPYEIEPIAPFVANLTCNPGIIYDLFLHNPEANVGGAFTNRDEVLAEIGRILGPGCDISVELNNPFEPDFSRIVEEAARFRELLSPYRVVIKVPHTGPVNMSNVDQLFDGDKRLDVRYSSGTTEDRLRGHNLALKLGDEGFRVNFTLMFEPHQSALALQVRPAYINAFIRHRKRQTERIAGLLTSHEVTDDPAFLTELRSYMVSTDYLSSRETDLDLASVESLARDVLHIRGVENLDAVGDGLDSGRHALRVLRASNLPDTRLILCSMEGGLNYPDVDRMLMEPEFEDMIDRVVVTAEPQYLARFTSTNQVVSYQRRFMTAARGQT